MPKPKIDTAARTITANHTHRGAPSRPACDSSGCMSSWPSNRLSVASLIEGLLPNQKGKCARPTPKGPLGAGPIYLLGFRKVRFGTQSALGSGEDIKACNIYL